MAPYDRGYSGRRGMPGGDWSDPYGDVGGTRYPRERAGNRPWVGGYRDGYQGGSGGVPTRGVRYGGDYRGGTRYGGDFRSSAGYGGDFRSGARYGGDYWWIGEHELDRQAGPRGYSYDEAYRRFDQQTHPRYSPVGGTYAAMGGAYAYGRPPRPLREDTWFSDWTRWF